MARGTLVGNVKFIMENYNGLEIAKGI